VLDVVHAFEKASGKKIAFDLTGRRAGDVAQCWADTKKARQLFNWQAKRTLDDMCRDTWHWQQKNPTGYHV
jgi:UDP-glucose 4-epimerase